jgi:hypothetical protein
MNEGLVAKSWSDSGDVPVGEVTYTYSEQNIADAVFAAAEKVGLARAALSLLEPKPSGPNAKPSNPALCRVAGEAYRGLGWCDE